MTIALFLKIYEVTENVTIEPHHCLSRNCFFSIHTFLYYFYSVNFLAFFFLLRLGFTTTQFVDYTKARKMLS
jgi:hypothetical protein